jgi:hypothetical protein
MFGEMKEEEVKVQSLRKKLERKKQAESCEEFTKTNAEKAKTS